MALRKNNKRSTDAKEPAKRQKTDEAEEEDVEAEAEVEQPGEEAHDADDQDEEKVEQEPQEEEVHSAKEAEASAPEKVPEEKKGPTSRLMIRQIVLENFKSYGGVKVIGPFHKSFSSIVGPNGSGKSNTIDALLFVFGKRAKKMRLNKVSELIHCSNAMPNLNSAKVEVKFQDILDTGDGPEDYEVVEGSVLTVTREAFRNNQSKYYVDGKTSNFTDVVQLLRKRGVDLDHNRFLILQGEVEQISLMKPKAQSVHEDGLLEYLEDIIGSNRLLEPIEEADGIVEKLTEQRQEKLNRLRVAEREKEALDGPRKEAETWVSGEAERLELQSVLAQSQVRKSQANLGSLEDEHKVLQGHMKEHKKKMEGFEKEVKGIEAEHNNHLKDYNSIKGNMEKKAEKFKEFERQDVKYTEDIAFQEQKIQKLSQASEEEQEKAKQLIKDAEKLRNDAPVREQELESTERFRANQAAKLEKLYEGLKGKAEKLRPAKEAKEKELVPLQKKLTEVKQVVEVAQAEAGFLRKKQVEATEQIGQLKKESGECREALTKREQEAKEAGKMLKERKKLVADAKDRVSQVTSQLDQVAKEVALARAKAEEAKNEFEQEQYRGKLITAVSAEAKAGRLKGVYGRLGDLGSINKKYDVAVSTACGMLDAIVVESTEDAQAVIEFVRRQDLGRTTCVCMQKIQDRAKHMNSFNGAPENAQRLVDLIQPEKPQYKAAFFFALGNTLVAKDLEQATRIGLQGKTRHRVVSLQGGLIDTSGTMSGGGGKVASGGMRASVSRYSQQDVKGFVQAYEEANGRLQAIRQEREALEEALRQTDKEISELELKEQKCAMDMNALKKQAEVYDARLKSTKIPQLSAEEKAKIKQLEKLIESRSDELKNIMEQHQAVEEQVRELHNQIMNLGGDEMKQAKAKLEECTKKCEDLRRQCKKALLDADNMVKNSKKAEANAKTAKEEHKAAEKTLKKLKEEHAALDDKAEVVLNEYNKLKESLSQKDVVLTDLREKRDEVIKKASALKSQEVDLVNEMEEKTRTLRDLHSRIAGWTNKLQEAKKDYAQLPLDFLKELREQEASVSKLEEISRKAISQELSEKELAKVSAEDVEERMNALEENIKNLKPNLNAIEEFRRADGEHRARLTDYEQVHNDREDARRKLEQLRQQRMKEFMEGFSVISMKLKEMYQMITLGGDAELELVDTLDPFNEGIHFSVRPPKKSWKQITNLSGGEKTLASLSLVFALHHYRPTPLYFMDEIDAALDFRNVSIIANYIKERTKNAQFIVISLRNHMFELADLLVGIYKTFDVSKSVAINPSCFDVAKEDQVGVQETGGSKRPLPIQGPSGGNAKKKAKAGS